VRQQVLQVQRIDIPEPPELPLVVVQNQQAGGRGGLGVRRKSGQRAGQDGEGHEDEPQAGPPVTGAV
jgi:hypothetical protein